MQRHHRRDAALRRHGNGDRGAGRARHAGAEGTRQRALARHAQDHGVAGHRWRRRVARAVPRVVGVPGVSGVLVEAQAALERLRDIRPESRYFNLALFDWARPAGLSVESTSDADATAAQAFEPYFDAKWNDAVVSYAASRCYESDQGDTANANLAAEQMSKFEKLAMS